METTTFASRQFKRATARTDTDTFQSDNCNCAWVRVCESRKKKKINESELCADAPREEPNGHTHALES